MIKERKRNRLKGYNYSRDGWYFITICIKNRRELFGNIVGSKMILNVYGKFVQQCWMDITDHFLDISLDEFIIMPNHVHGIVSVENRHAYSLRKRQYQKIPVTIGSFKSATSQLIHNHGLPDFQWQKSYYDHIIRNEKSLHNIRKYIKNNPQKWLLGKDRNHLTNI